MTSVCSVGLDMIAIPGDTPAETIAAIIADEMAIGVINDKTTAVRLIPVPGAKAGDQRRLRRPVRFDPGPRGPQRGGQPRPLSTSAGASPPAPIAAAISVWHSRPRLA